MNAEIVADTRCLLGEGPVWNPLDQHLYWTDIEAGRMYRFNPATGSHEQVYEGRSVAGYTFQPDGAMILFRDKGNIVIYENGSEVQTLVEQIYREAALDGGRFNDVIADPLGGVFCGTLSNERDGGVLYRLAPDGSLSVANHGCTICNGMGFTPDRKQMYFTDTLINAIWLFDFDGETAGLTNQRLWAKTPPAADAGMPDGLTVDAAGTVWSARWGGAAVVRMTDDGRDADRIDCPANCITSMMFGGEDLSDMYITCAGGDDRETNGPAAGALLRATPGAGAGVKGVLEFHSRIGL